MKSREGIFRRSGLHAFGHFSLLAMLLVLWPAARLGSAQQPLNGAHDLVFDRLPSTWDEGVPLGNGMLGVLVWQKGQNLRLSLDRADLWDLRPMDNLTGPEWSFDWVRTKWAEKDYEAVQEKFDAPYERNPAPTKIPAASLEFDISVLGDVSSVRLDLERALCEVRWTGGARFLAFVHATESVGWYRFEGALAPAVPELVPPPYAGEVSGLSGDSVAGQDLRLLGYKKGKVVKEHSALVFEQEGWNGFHYDVAIAWRDREDAVEGAWSISAHRPDQPSREDARAVVSRAVARGFGPDHGEHAKFWARFWRQSAIHLPDPVLEKQWYQEMYKFGSASRRGAPPISLQAVWTADNGRIPPWKGDFHHDLNTQLSYWPCYSSNHLEEGLAFLDWLWEIRPAALAYTRHYFSAGGLNVPGVTTLTGQPMGGWIQYSFGPTISAWLAHHFYLHWRYSQDRRFLEDRAYPWLREVALFLESISVKDAQGLRKLPLSSSPEFFDNSSRAWFDQTTNFDLALIRWTYEIAAELALELGKTDEAATWKGLLAQWPGLAVDPDEGLLIAPGVSYGESHRHFSHLMAIHPLGLIDAAQGERERAIVRRSLAHLESRGTGLWVGYSFAWLGNLKARAGDGDGAAEALQTFATAFCLPNGFHVNGDQSGRGYSRFTYRPFTLEGNFAFAAGIQEMLLQSHAGVLRILPAVPKSWDDVRFENLRAEGAFLVSAEMRNGRVREVRIRSEKGGRLRIQNPFRGRPLRVAGMPFSLNEGIIGLEAQPGEVIILRDESLR